MEYRAVGKRCAVNLESLNLQMSEQAALVQLAMKEIGAVEVHLVELARRCIGVSRYRRGARAHKAPAVVDCSSLTKWLYGQRGIWLPRRSIQQRDMGEVVHPGDIEAGDLIFVSGAINYYDTDPADGVGHVGIATGKGSVIHAADSKAGVIESPFSKFAAGTKFRGARRYIPRDKSIITLQFPQHRDVECSSDVRWIILQHKIL